MAASSVQNPVTQGEANPSKKKKAKGTAAERIESPAPTAASEAGDDAGETPYIRDIQKNIRNINKKISNMAKTETVVAENPGKSLEELVAAKLINADQKAQISKKPALQAQVVQLEEQLVQYKKIDQEYRTRLQTEKAELEKTLTQKLEQEKVDAVNEIKQKLEADHVKDLHDTLLHLSQFLRLAAARRSEDVDPMLDENLALEGILLGVYGGDEIAVDCIIKLTKGTEDRTQSVNGDLLQTTFAQVKALSEAFTKAHSEDVEAESQEQAPTAGEATTAVTDPTVANASLTEIKAGEDTALTNGHAEEQSAPTPANGTVTNETANASGEKWDTGTSGNDLSGSTISQEWVNVSRESTEIKAGQATDDAPAPNGQSWADDHPEPSSEPAAQQTDANDGFHQVQGRNRSRNDREGGGQWRGRGRGDYRGGRGGGYRGDGRGRGRGGQRGGAARGPRRTEES
ncbi:hypothetical protein SODALDRAFT_267352 [Sodiomyces alkalinus F11]|uniref:YAG7-like dimerisation domain-containing protein n=1 Tax=Sodiomyces alkalinus (strain CBS 110278 / VKM F-3762 / F11) TaxID=1314773 RepID=A0A3N2Q6X7_SODAK|nr:hypothetical protein SODALDRAFT_267352 [Sodiomyces alkalinus F11]ROT42437.1 hypothetical protein SODALDRAFT_267352 [Sodiomyces alkalinus F11]